MYQKTLSQNVSFKGIGLHSGENVTINVTPAKDDEGIVFKRVDLDNNNYIKANFANVSSAKLCTTLVNNHGVFTWGGSPKDAIKNAEAIEMIAKMALNSLVINPDINPINKNLHNKHFYRKHGENKYYGQK